MKGLQLSGATKPAGGGGGRTQEGLWPPLTQERPSGAGRRTDRASSAVMFFDLRVPFLDMALRHWLIGAHGSRHRRGNVRAL